MKILLFLSLILICLGCNESNPQKPQEVSPMIIISKQIVVLDFSAKWCPPCRTFGPVFDKWKEKYTKANVSFKKVDVDEDKEMATKFKISALPTVVITVDGVEVKRFVGMPKEDQVLEYLK